MTTKKLYNFRLPIPLMQQVDLVADNRTEFLTRAVQDALEREALSSGAAMKQPYLQEYIEHLKKEAEEWKATALQISGLPRNCSMTDAPQLVDEEEAPEAVLQKPISVETLHSEIDEVLQMFQEKARTPQQ